MRRLALIATAVVVAGGVAALLILNGNGGGKDDRDPESAPILSLAGSLWDAEGADPALRPGNYSLSVAAVDGDVDHPHEGVARVTIAMDGRTVVDRRFGCTNATCKAKLLWPFDTSAQAPGEHTIRVTAADDLGNASSRVIGVVVRGVEPPTTRCWPDPSHPYPYADQQDNPRCRATLAGATDHALSAKVSYGRAARVLIEPMRRGRHRLADSFGQPFGYFEQIGLKRFRIYDQRGRLYGTTTGSTVAEVQGRGCMVTNAMASRYVILAIYAPDGSIGIGPHGGKRDVGARGFVRRDLLRRGVFHRASATDSVNNDAVIDRFRTGCGKAPPHRAAGLPHVPLVKPSYAESDRYQGAKQDCPRPESRVCGGHYSNYSRPRFSADAVPLASATTGVRNGGIIRAYVRASRPFQILDAIGYADPNVPCGQSPAARWFFVDANPTPAPGENHIYGWFPRRVHGLPPRRC